ncbi:hypothetical protein LZ023_36840 (plasmid) [Pseudomonas silvicola]|nr:hypothetical protein LZ023_36840 [Pseudomonas silvicola]
MLVVLPIAARAAQAIPDRQRIVAINWAAAETLLSLGVTPLAISDSHYFRQRIPRPLLLTAWDIGAVLGPNLEMLAACALL